MKLQFSGCEAWRVDAWNPASIFLNPNPTWVYPQRCP